MKTGTFSVEVELRDEEDPDVVAEELFEFLCNVPEDQFPYINVVLDVVWRGEVEQ